MSLALAKAWVNATIRQPQARADALRLLDEAQTRVVPGDLIVGPRLSPSGKCVFGRWDGRELVVLELTKQQQRDWGVDPRALYEELEWPMSPAVTTPTELTMSLEIKQVNGRDDYDGWKSLSGICVAESQTTPFWPIRNCAVRAQYFRPQMPRPVTHMWYAPPSLNSTRTELPFHFSPLFSEMNPQTFHGSLVVFLQLFTADDWVKQVGCRAVSNVAYTMLTIK